MSSDFPDSSDSFPSPSKGKGKGKEKDQQRERGENQKKPHRKDFSNRSNHSGGGKGSDYSNLKIVNSHSPGEKKSADGEGEGGKEEEGDDSAYFPIPSAYFTDEKSFDLSSHKILDGSLLEGGGQVLRNSFSYAALLNFPLSVNHIRGKRSKPGLRAQHLEGITTVHQITGGKLVGASINSCEIEYIPSGGHFTVTDRFLRFSIDPKTAGAIGLLIQTTLPLLIFLPYPTIATYRGGTNATNAPIFDYTESVLFPTLRRWFGRSVDQLGVQCNRRGYFPRGGGEVILNIQPISQTALNPLTLLDRGDIVEIRIFSLISGRVPADVSARMAEAAEAAIRSAPFFNEKIKIKVDHSKLPSQVSPDDGCFILLVGETSTGCLFGSQAIGEKGRAAHLVAKEATDALIRDLSHGGCTDEWLTDQLVIFMALASGVSRVRCGPLSLHTKTAIHWARELTGAKIITYKAKGTREQHIQQTKNNMNSSSPSASSSSPSSSSSFSLPSPSPAISPSPTDTDDTFIIEVHGMGYVSRWKEYSKRVVK